MVSVKMLKPYFIKVNAEYIRIILAYEYFSIVINEDIYNFIPIEGQEILINRKTRRIVNTDTKFAFQKDDRVIYLTLKKLTTLKDFMVLINKMIDPYYTEEIIETHKEEKANELIFYLEKENVKRLIDKSLDEGDLSSFNYYVNVLKEYERNTLVDRTEGQK